MVKGYPDFGFSKLCVAVFVDGRFWPNMIAIAHALLITRNIGRKTSA